MSLDEIPRCTYGKTTSWSRIHTICRVLDQNNSERLIQPNIPENAERERAIQSASNQSYNNLIFNPHQQGCLPHYPSIF